MKSCVGSAPVFLQLRRGFYRKYCHFVAKTTNFSVVKGCVKRQHQLLLGIGILLVLCWTIGSIWLINLRQEEQSTEEILERREILAGLLP